MKNLILPAMITVLGAATINVQLVEAMPSNIQPVVVTTSQLPLPTDFRLFVRAPEDDGTDEPDEVCSIAWPYCEVLYK